MQSHPHSFAPGYPIPNGAPQAAPAPGATPLLPNNGRVIQNGPTRILCIADVRGMIPRQSLEMRDREANLT